MSTAGCAGPGEVLVSRTVKASSTETWSSLSQICPCPTRHQCRVSCAVVQQAIGTDPIVRPF